MASQQTPTIEQQNIISNNGNIAVIATPGSGKTYTLSQKIKNILKELPNYKGVIAISYTNKASIELKQRAMEGGIYPKNSFFGTIDSFFYSELILPFLPTILKIKDSSNIETLIYRETKKEKPNDIEAMNKILQNKCLDDNDVSFIRNILMQNYFYVDLISIVGKFTYEKSETAKIYLKARYSHVIIDEYQDSDYEQHFIFCKLVELGITGIAVGDIDQSIYRWAGKYPEYLEELQSRPDFNSYTLTRNHRSHDSIVTYSKKLLLPELIVNNTGSKRVYLKSVNGTQEQICNWIDANIGNIKKELNIEHNNKIAILSRNNFCGVVVNEYLKTPNKLIENTILEACSEPWARIFSDILFYIFDKNILTIDFIDKWLIYDIKKSLKTELTNDLISLKNMPQNELCNNIHLFEKCVKIIAPNDHSTNALNVLGKVLQTEKDLNTYKPASENELQIMTIFKSKGLEFDVVFHLDMYEGVIPSKRALNDVRLYKEDLNIHYVGLTRAKKACFIIISSKNIVLYNGERNIWNSKPSRFLSINDLNNLRHNLI